jgi:hypothetical protein
MLRLRKREEYANLHGITVDNVECFLVPPFQVPVDPDDLETEVGPMWVVLQEADDPTAAYVVVYDPAGVRCRWDVAQYVRDGDFVLVTGVMSLSEALSSM